MLLAILDRRVDQLGVFGLLGGGEDERRVRGGILRLVFLNGVEITRIADDSLESKACMLAISGDAQPEGAERS